MKQCNNKETSDKVYELFEEKLNDFKFIGEVSWSDPAGAMVWPTYEIEYSNKKYFCALVKWFRYGYQDINREGVIITLESPQSYGFSGHITEVVVPFEFKRTYSTRAYEENGMMEIRNYGSFNVGNQGTKKKEEFFNFVREYNRTVIYIDEENKPYIKVFEIKNGNISKEDFAKSLIDFTLLVKAFKDRYR